MALEMDPALQGDIYNATPEELKAIGEADRSGTVGDRDVEAAFATFRRA
jgi:hypothetical protein